MEGTPVPSGTYIRIRFEEAVDLFLSRLADQLQTNASGQFFSQSDTRAGLNNAPFHIKILSSVELAGQSCQTVYNVLNDVGAKFEAVKGNILPVCALSRFGVVSLKINCSGCIPVGRYLSQQLPGANDYCSKNDNLLVSIGTFEGPQIAAFENWLNNELAANSGIFPRFTGGTIELSEECNAFPHEPVKLSGGSPRARITPTAPTLAEGSGPAPSGGDVKKGNSPTAASKDHIANVGQRLLSAVRSLSDQVGGLGLINFPADVSRPFLCTIVPTEIQKCQEQLGKIFNLLDNLRSHEGPKVFLAALDAVANPTQDSLLKALGSNTALDFVPVLEPKVEADAGAIGSDSGRLSGLSVSLTVGAATAPISTTGSAIEGPTGSPLIVVKASSSNNGSNGSNGRGKPGSGPGAWVGLHVEAAGLSNLGLKPAEGSHFYIPFGWIGFTEATPTSKRSGGTRTSGNSAKVAASHAFAAAAAAATKEAGKPVNEDAGPKTWAKAVKKDLHAGNSTPAAAPTPFTKKPAYSTYSKAPQHPKGSSGFSNRHADKPVATAAPVATTGTSAAAVTNQEPVGKSKGEEGAAAAAAVAAGGKGNWTCPNCKINVFAKRVVCFKCHTFRPADHDGGGAGGAPRKPPVTDGHPDGDVRDGDWICAQCKGHNFATKIACFTCRTPRPPGYEKDLETRLAEQPGKPAVVMHGDWTCPKCKENVFAKRNRCYKCSTSKPR